MGRWVSVCVIWWTRREYSHHRNRYTRVTQRRVMMARDMASYWSAARNKGLWLVNNSQPPHPRSHTCASPPAGVGYEGSGGVIGIFCELFHYRRVWFIFLYLGEVQWSKTVVKLNLWVKMIFLFTTTNILLGRKPRSKYLRDMWLVCHRLVVFCVYLSELRRSQKRRMGNKNRDFDTRRRRDGGWVRGRNIYLHLSSTKLFWIRDSMSTIGHWKCLTRCWIRRGKPRCRVSLFWTQEMRMKNECLVSTSLRKCSEWGKQRMCLVDLWCLAPCPTLQPRSILIGQQSHKLPLIG